MLRGAGEGTGDFVAPPGQFGPCDSRITAFVHHIVYLPAKGIERGHGLFLFRVEKQKAEIKAGAAGSGLLFAVLLGCHVGVMARIPANDSRPVGCGSLCEQVFGCGSLNDGNIVN